MKYMKIKDILLIILGVILAVICIELYQILKPRAIHYYDNIELVDLNNEITRQRANAIVLAARKVSPTLVSITVIQTKVVTTSPFATPFNDDFFRDFFHDFFPEYYYRKKIKNLGSGVIISSDGYILTNEHVISSATDINLTLTDGRQFKGEIVASCQTRDLALLKIKANNLPFAELGNSDDLMIGEWVIALGNPFGFLLEDARPTVTVGVVSALNRAIKSTREDRVYKNMIQTDAAINPGNSGGPLVNVLGQVIGINTAIFTSGGGSEGIGFARPINDVRKFIEEAREFGKIRIPWVGLWMQNITPEVAEAMGIEKAGTLVSNVDKKSSADEAGIKEGDRIVTVNDIAINTVSDWDRLVSGIFVDDTLDITLLRANNTITARLIVKEFNQASGVQTSLTVYGIHIEDINSILMKTHNLTYDEGVVVVKVAPNSIGQKLGIKVGDVILMVGNMRIRNKDDFQKALQTYRDINFIIDRGGLIIQLYLGL